MVLFADNKYRYSLQWDAFSEEQIRAGQLMERLGNHKSKVVVPALIEYMERHPEVMLPDGKINISFLMTPEQVKEVFEAYHLIIINSSVPIDYVESELSEYLSAYGP